MVCTFDCRTPGNLRRNIMKNVLCILASTAGLLLIQGLTRADDPRANDREFLLRAATAGHAEVKFSELADKRSTNEKVREFAALMTREHTEANRKLAEHARDQKIAVVSGFERDKREIYMNLSRLSGDEFDRAYMKQMLQDHDQAVRLFEHESRKGTDPQLRKFAEETLPTIREHQKRARELNDALKSK
jgi:putative membrane protein